MCALLGLVLAGSAACGAERPAGSQPAERADPDAGDFSATSPAAAGTESRPGERQPSMAGAGSPASSSTAGSGAGQGPAPQNDTESEGEPTLASDAGARSEPESPVDPPSTGEADAGPTPPAETEPQPEPAPPPPFPDPADFDYTPSPDNPPECPDVAPENPLGPCAGLPVYLECNYTDYHCICDWVHWLCL